MKKRGFFDIQERFLDTFSPLKEHLDDQLSLLQTHVVDPMKKQVHKNVHRFQHSMDALKKMFMTYEEPYSEISQTASHFFIHVKLPDVHKKNIFLRILQGKVEVYAYKVVKKEHKKALHGFSRTISIPPHIIPERARAIYTQGKLKIKIPLRNL